jgi:hypothetical protein
MIQMVPSRGRRRSVLGCGRLPSKGVYRRAARGKRTCGGRVAFGLVWRAVTLSPVVRCLVIVMFVRCDH